MPRERAEAIPRTDLLKYKNRSQPSENNITWAMDFSPLAGSIASVIRRNWHFLQDIPGCNFPPRIGFRQTRSLRDMLVHSDLKTQEVAPNLPQGHFPCGHCNVCPLSTDPKNIVHPRTGRPLFSKYFSTCATSNVVYLVQCTCTLFYVGSTSRPIRLRVQEHISKIRARNQAAPLSQHFQIHHRNEKELKFTVLEVVSNPGYANRHLLQAEARWIFRLNTLTPAGLNNELDYSVFL